MLRLSVVWMCVLVATSGCSSLLGIEDLGGATRDGGPDGPPMPFDGGPRPVKFSGRIQLFADITTGFVPASDAVVDVLEAQSGTTLGSTLSDADGVYSVTWDQPGNLDVFLFVKRPDAMDTFVYFSRLQLADATRDFMIITPSGLQQLAEFGGSVQDVMRGAALVIAEAPDGRPIAGAKITATPSGNVVYASGGQIPQSGSTETDDSGAAYIFSAPNPTNITITPPEGTPGSAFYPLDVPPGSVSYLPLLVQ